MFSLESKSAIVTGAGRGLGQATAQLLAELGARVLVVDIDNSSASQTAADIVAKGGSAIAHRTDLENADEIPVMIERAVAEFGGLDILVNNAALTDPEHFAQDLDVATMTSEVWDRTFAVNVRATMLACKLTIPHMIERGGGSIINLASMMGMGGDVVNSAYGSSKAAVAGLTKYVASQNLKKNIRCNAVAPGLVFTQAAREQAPEQLAAIFEAQQSHIGEPLEIAQIVAYLASDWSTLLTGQLINADGGMFAHVPVQAGRAEFYGYSY